MRLGRHPLPVIFDRDDGFARTVDAPTDLSRAATVSGDVLEYGIEGRLSWVKFCENVPAERTAETAQAQEFLAGMQSHQKRD